MPNKTYRATNSILVQPILNSLLRDFSDHGSVCVDESKLIIKSGSESLKINFHYYSLVGLHRYENEITDLEGHPKTIEDLIDLLVTIFSAEKEFKEQVLKNCEELEKIIQRKREITNYLESEQMLFLGHPFHPFPKLKGNISNEEIEKYSPEYANGFEIIWVQVDPNYLSLVETSEEITLAALREFDLGLDKKDEPFIPMHPLQYEDLIRANFKIGDRELSSSTFLYGVRKWFACSSMRTLYSPDGPSYLKFSLPVKLTNSIRILNGSDLKRSNVINQVFEVQELTTFFNQYPHFHIQRESTFGGIKVGDQLDDRTIFQLREKLKGKVEESYVLATLCESIDDAPLIRKIALEATKDLNFSDSYKIENWFSRFLDNVIKPIMALAFGEGVLVGAHLQNLIVEFKDGYPIGVEYRDCQGTGLTKFGKERFNPEVTKEALVIDEDNINKVFGYYLVVNTIFTTVGALAFKNKKTELILLNSFKNFLFGLKKELPRGIHFFDYWIDQEQVYQKGNFRCTVGSNDENTMENPWAIYNRIINPLSSLRKSKIYSFDNLLEKVNPRNGKKLSLRKINVDKDLDIFHEWHNKDFVSEFWELNFSKEKLKKYLEDLYDSNSTLPLIVELDGSPIGYFEVYWAFDDRIAPYCNPSVYDRGIHLLFGEERVLRTRHVFDALGLITDFCFYDDPRTEHIWGEPRADNTNVLKFAGALTGWEVLEEFSFPHKRARLLCCNKSVRAKEVQYE